VTTPSDNPYAPPSTDPSAARVEVPDGSLWLVHEGELFVRDRASLPDVCISGSRPEEPGTRRSVPIHTSRWWVLLVLLSFSPALFAKSGILFLAAIVAGHLVSNIGKKIRVMVFESHRGLIRKRLHHWIVVVGSAVLTFWLIDSSGHWIASSEFSMVMVACGFYWNFPGHRFRAVPFKEGWYELRGIAPAAIARMEEIQRERRSGRTTAGTA
jgi:hypothetical protein